MVHGAAPPHRFSESPVTTEAWLIVGIGAALAVLVIATARSVRAEIAKLGSGHAELREGLVSLKKSCKPVADRGRIGGSEDAMRKSDGPEKKFVHAVERPRVVSNYVQRRRTQIYYRYVSRLVRGVAPQIHSILDVGSGKTSCLEQFDWIPIRKTIDIAHPYTSESVEGVKADFLEYQVDERYDLALCLQVLEHVPQVEVFTRKLFDVSRSVLISVPYKWPKGSIKGHIHDPVDEAKLHTWTKRKPDYQIIVTEPFGASRLFAYYHRPDEVFSRSDAQRSMEDALVEVSVTK